MSGRRVAALLTCLALAEVTAAIVLAVIADMSFDDALNGFVVTNGLMGVSFAACGGVIAWHHPRNAVGWLFVADGLGHATGAIAVAARPGRPGPGRPGELERLAVTVLMWSWPWSIGLCLPLALLLVPRRSAGLRRAGDGWSGAVVADQPAVRPRDGAARSRPRTGLPSGLPDRRLRRPRRAVDGRRAAHLLAILLAVVCLVLRYRRGDETRRRQLLWLVLRRVVVVAILDPVVASSPARPIVVLFAIPLIPVAVTVGIVRAPAARHPAGRLPRRRLGAARRSPSLAGYVRPGRRCSTLRRRPGSARSALVTVLVALALAPLLPRLQRQVDRWMYGDRRDPARVATRVGEQLAARDGDGDLGRRRCRASRRAAAAVRRRRGPARDHRRVGSAPGRDRDAAAGRTAARDVGELVVGLRAGERRARRRPTARRSTCSPAPLAVAVRAIELTADLERSRERLVAAREEERRRIRQRPPRRPRPDAHRRRPLRRRRGEPDRRRPGRGPRAADATSAATPGPRSPTYAGSSTTCARRRSTSSG